MAQARQKLQGVVMARREGGPVLPTVDLAYPFEGRWLTQNSPANRVPSHGTDLFATTFAIDFVPVDEAGRTAPVRLASLIRPEPPERFPGFGRPVLAPVDGVVVAVHDTEPDHRSFRGFPSIGYALTQRRRAAEGWVALAGNLMRARHGSAILGALGNREWICADAREYVDCAVRLGLDPDYRAVRREQLLRTMPISASEAVDALQDALVQSLLSH